jgi:hypothetical protein
MTDLERFDALLKKTLSISKEELQRRLEAEKASKTASSRVRAGKG